MSATTENGPNGFTAVNDGGMAQNLAVKALNHKDWTNGDSSNGYSPSPYANQQGKRRIGDVESSGDEARPPPPPPAQSAMNGSRPAESTEDARSSQAHAAASRESNGNGFMDEAQMAELLQQGARQASESQSENMENESPNRGSQSAAEGTSPADPNANSGDVPIITNAGLQVDMKKRKRAFTNRTKTGCATCRKRKKKCDEGKPACNNCIRGGFTCLGYSQKKDLGPKGPSMGRTPNPAIAPAHDYWQDRSGARSARNPSYDEGIHGLPHSMHEIRHTPLGHDQRSMSQWSTPGYTSRPLTDRPAPPPPPPSFASRNLGLSGGLPSYANTIPGPMAQARSAQEAYNQSELNNRLNEYPPRPSSVENGSSSHMAKENKYKPTEGVLTKDRDACRLLCRDLNSGIMGGNDIVDIRRRVLDIIQPKTLGGSPSGSPSRVGELGKNVTVDAPFRADYGYNLNIGDDVFIESDCHFKDPAPIYIGPKTRIGANVLISSEYKMVDPEWQEWSRKIPIRIGKNCTIGDNCVITAPDKPGNQELIIGDNVWIGPGNVISYDVPHYTVIPAPAKHPGMHVPSRYGHHMRPV